MRLRLLVAVVVLVFGTGGCGGDTDPSGERAGADIEPSGEAVGGTQQISYQASNTSDPACEQAFGHPIQVTARPAGYFVACSNEGGTSLHLRNTSSSVLLIRPYRGYAFPTIRSVFDGFDAPGVVAAQNVIRTGWLANSDTFVLSLGESAVAKANGLVGVVVEPHLSWTAQANVARWAVGWLTQRIQAPQRNWIGRARQCAESATKFAEVNVDVGQVLRNALGTSGCISLMRDALRSDAADTSASAVARMRSGILAVARPVAEDRLIAILGKVLAAR